jgi:hypothetical protein
MPSKVETCQVTGDTSYFVQGTYGSDANGLGYFPPFGNNVSFASDYEYFYLGRVVYATQWMVRVNANRDGSLTVESVMNFPE